MATHVVTAEYDAVEDTELSIALDDLVIIGETEGGWSHATNVKTGKSGWIPADFVDKVEETIPPPPPEIDSPALAPQQPSANTSKSVAPAAATNTASAPKTGGFRSPQASGGFQPPSQIAGGFQPPAAPPAASTTPLDSSAALQAKKAELALAEAAALAALADAQKATGAVDPNLPVCHGCKANVFAGQAYVGIKERTFHAEHFVCVTCKKSLQGVPVIERDDKFYCKDDFYNEYGKKMWSLRTALNGTIYGSAW